MTVQRPTVFAIPLMLLGWVGACAPTTQPTIADTAGTEAFREACIQWRDSLPTRSRNDTERTQQEIGYAYDVQGMVCPQWARFPSP